jgi:hypothetical protein
MYTSYIKLSRTQNDCTYKISSSQSNRHIESPNNFQEVPAGFDDKMRLGKDNDQDLVLDRSTNQPELVRTK